MKRSVLFFGWSTIIVSVILIFSQIIGLAITSSVDQITGLLGDYPGVKIGILDPMKDMFAYDRIWSYYSICYFLVTLGAAIQFVRLREIGRRILEIACWVGMLNACVDTIVSYGFWKQMEALMGTLSGGVGLPLNQLNPLGLGSIIVGFFLWIIPSVGILVFLRRPALRAFMSSVKAHAIP